MRGGAVVSAGRTLDVEVVSPPLTAATITEGQIRKLRDDAGALGDDRQVDYCNVALAPYRFANDDGSVLVYPWNGQDADRTVARKVCADAINAARAADDDEIGGES